MYKYLFGTLLLIGWLYFIDGIWWLALLAIPLVMVAILAINTYLWAGVVLVLGLFAAGIMRIISFPGYWWEKNHRGNNKSFGLQISAANQSNGMINCVYCYQSMDTSANSCLSCGKDLDLCPHCLSPVWVQAIVCMACNQDLDRD